MMSVRPHPTCSRAARIADHEKGVVQLTYFAERTAFFFGRPDGSRVFALTLRVISRAGREPSATVLRDAVSLCFSST